VGKRKNPENQDLLQLGQKARAGRMISEYIRAIGTETDQVIQPDVPRGCAPEMPRMVSKAEALARYIWKKALPHTDDEGVHREPDIRYVSMVLDRTEGKASVAAEDKDAGRETVPEKVSRLGVERLNKLAEGE
jgi:hypothetical protein